MPRGNQAKRLLRVDHPAVHDMKIEHSFPKDTKGATLSLCGQCAANLSPRGPAGGHQGAAACLISTMSSSIVGLVIFMRACRCLRENRSQVSSERSSSIP